MSDRSQLIETGKPFAFDAQRDAEFERLAKRYRGRVTFWGQFDGGRLSNPGKPEEFREAVMAYRRALDFGAGGVIAQCQWEPAARLHTVAAYFEHWLVPLPMHG